MADVNNQILIVGGVHYTMQNQDDGRVLVLKRVVPGDPSVPSS